ncbi:glutathione S-transferase family protein [Caulobacter sp. KR2-114]|uniref:glutathione S-transferase family protein n=1 Tax=Caulobacter sp. KR2-114 TaxID=3400912 RepID=UPI003C0B3867
MSDMFTLYSAAGSGGVAVEAALTILDLPYRVVEMGTWFDPEAAEAIAAVNPMRQVPALVLPDGTLMTESAAILIWLAETYPAGRLGAAPGDPGRPAFLRWMTFVSAAVYSLFWIRDKPERLVDGEAAAAQINARTKARIAECWSVLDAGLTPGAYLLGDELSVLDLYVAVISRWAEKGRSRFYRAAPKLADGIRRVDADPRLAALWAERFPFTPGWEGV